MIISKKVHFERGSRSRKTIRIGEATQVPIGRIQRVTKLMALAIRFDQMIRDGEVKNQAELAHVGHVTRARLSQIMNLLNLSPYLQETILYLPRVESGKDLVTERELRPIAAVYDWHEQRKLWIAR